jgi:hypothetical protein
MVVSFAQNPSVIRPLTLSLSPNGPKTVVGGEERNYFPAIEIRVRVNEEEIRAKSFFFIRAPVTL